MAGKVTSPPRPLPALPAPGMLEWVSREKLEELYDTYWNAMRRPSTDSTFFEARSAMLVIEAELNRRIKTMPEEVKPEDKEMPRDLSEWSDKELAEAVSVTGTPGFPKGMGKEYEAEIARRKSPAIVELPSPDPDVPQPAQKKVGKLTIVFYEQDQGNQNMFHWLEATCSCGKAVQLATWRNRGSESIRSLTCPECGKALFTVEGS